jgi:alkylated DNA repair protein alkB family protein 8
VNDYPDCMGIASHVDTHSAFAPVLCSLSLASSAVIEFRRGTHRRSLLLPRRSLLLFSDEARYGWSHGIPTRATDVVLCHHQPGGDGGHALPTQLVHRSRRRMSLTFRRTLPPGHVCTCAWPEECDSRVMDPCMARGPADQWAPASDVSRPAADTGASVPAVEVQHVWELYERIAPHFSATRVAIWPAVRTFLCSLAPHSLVLDAGCGNGKYVGPALGAGHAVIGCDVATALLRDCTTKTRQTQALVHGALFRADVASAELLPLRPGGFDAVLCVAVLHHISSPGRRASLLQGIARALKPGGRAIITAWATDQMEPERTVRKWKHIIGEHHHQAGDAAGMAPARQEYFVPWHVPLHRPEAGNAARHAAAGCGSAAVPAAAPVVDAAKNTVVFQRYVHLFVPGELAELAREVPGVVVEQEFFDASNWVIVIQRA